MTRKYNNGLWTQSRFQSFIKSALRSTSVKWPPRYTVLNEAFTEAKTNKATGRKAKHFRCNRCNGEFVQKDVQVNHIIPVVPLSGFTTWDEVVDRLFCEKDGLEVLCKPCHKEVTKEENDSRKINNAKRKSS